MNFNFSMSETSFDTIQSIFEMELLQQIDDFIKKEKCAARLKEKFFVKNCTKKKDIIDIFKSFGEYFNLYTAYVFFNKNDKFILVMTYINDIEYPEIRIDILALNDEILEDQIELIKKVLSPFLVVKNSVLIDWYFHDGSEVKSTKLLESWDIDISDFNYPYISNVKEFIDKYLESDIPLLLLHGGPGTGKTKLLQYILQTMSLTKKEIDKFSKNDSAITCCYTSDKNVIECGWFFSHFISSSSEILIIEDIDFHLDSRRNGNSVMYYLLNISDGLITNKKKKIILSTNLPSVRDMDEALLRKGRCYDTITFRNLTHKESMNFLIENKRKDLVDVIKGEEKEYSLAELYDILGKSSEDVKNFSSIKNKVGF